LIIHQIPQAKIEEKQHVHVDLSLILPPPNLKYFMKRGLKSWREVSYQQKFSISCICFFRKIFFERVQEFSPAKNGEIQITLIHFRV
jgi:hypothetical protein